MVRHVDIKRQQSSRANERQNKTEQNVQLSMHGRYAMNGRDKMSGNVHNAIIVGVNGPEDNTEGKYEGVSTKRRAIQGINSKCKFIGVVILRFHVYSS